MKCLNCDKEIVLDLEKAKDNPYYLSNFSKRKYCSDKCQKEKYKKRRKKSYKLVKTKHNDFVTEINKLLDGEIIIPNGHTIYNPDITKDNICYEVETFHKLTHLKDKATRWDKKDKHILIISPSNEVIELFDDTYLFYKGRLYCFTQ